jgi:hypothetical protein
VDSLARNALAATYGSRCLVSFDYCTTRSFMKNLCFYDSVSVFNCDNSIE